jgi:hypothetical protein
MFVISFNDIIMNYGGRTPGRAHSGGGAIPVGWTHRDPKEGHRMFNLSLEGIYDGGMTPAPPPGRMVHSHSNLEGHRVLHLSLEGSIIIAPLPGRMMDKGANLEGYRMLNLSLKDIFMMAA